MEYLPLGDLQSHLHSALTEIEGRQITKQILRGLAFLHEEDFAHRDLKPQNILVVSTAPNWRIKITDFGISKRTNWGATKLHTQIGTLEYMAPEVHGFLSHSEGKALDYGFTVDIWSLGAITYRILTGQSPFGDLGALYRYAERSSVFPIEPLLANAISQEGIKLIKRFLEPLPHYRLTAKEALKHAWCVFHDSPEENLLLAQSNCSLHEPSR